MEEDDELLETKKMEQDIELLETKIKMLKERLNKMRNNTNKTRKEIRKEKAIEANIEHFTNEINEKRINEGDIFLKKPSMYNKITRIDETRNGEKIINRDSPVKKSSSNSPHKPIVHRKSILKKKGGRKSNKTRKNKNSRKN